MSVVAAGVFVALVPLGLLAANTLGARHRRDRVALALPLGLAALSVPLAVAAALGHFAPHVNGVSGWIVALACTAVLWHRSWQPPQRDVGEAARRRTGALVILLAATFVQALAVVETPIGSRDEGLYTLAALALERTGSVVLAAPAPLAKASGLFEPFVSGIAFHLPGIPAGDALKPQFAPLLPAWIAQLHAAAGDAALYRFNLLATLALGAVVFVLARRLLRRPFALAALAVFAFNPATIWMARINLAEPLGAAFVLAGLLVTLDALRHPSGTRIAVAVFLLAVAAFVRADLIVIAPLLTAAAIALAIARPDRTWSRTVLRLSAWALAGQSAAIALVAAWSPPYIVDHLHFLVPAPAASAAGFVAYGVLGNRRSARLRAFVATLASVALVLLFAYAWLVRPYVEPFALIPDRGSALAGARDWREASLANLAAYLTWPCVLLAFGGSLVVIRRASRGRASPVSLLLGTLAIGAGIVYLAAPLVSPDHPWAIRRMFPLVIPLFALMAGFGLQAAARALLGWRSAEIAHVAALAAVAWLLLYQRSTLTYTENAGVTARLRAIDAELPPGTIVVRGFDGIATTLALGFGREILPLRDEMVAVDAASRAFWAACASQPCTLLHASYDGLDGLALGTASEGSLTREYVEPTVRPLARARKRETLHWLVSRVSGIANAPPPSNAGAARDWRLADRGFHRDELLPGMVARWTNGDAEVGLPSATADRVEVHLASAAPRAQPLRIELDGKAVFEGVIEPGESRKQFPLARRTDHAHRLALESAAFVPARIGSGGDRRTLGVSLRAIRLLDGAAPPLTAASPASDFRSGLTIRPTGRSPLDETRPVPIYRVDIDNLGTAAWPARNDADPGSAIGALGIYATRIGEPRRLLEQRIQLPYALAPGEHWTTALVLDLDAEPWNKLPAGNYEVHVGLVLEGVAWFADRGDRNATIPLTIAAR